MHRYSLHQNYIPYTAVASKFCVQTFHDFSELQTHNNGSLHKFPDKTKLDYRVDTSNVSNIESQ